MRLQEVGTERDNLVDFDESDGMWMESEAIKQSILHHDTMFRHQVLELHRLYWTQKNMTKEIPFDEINNYPDWSRKPGGISEKATEDRIFVTHHQHMNSTLGKDVEEWRQCRAHFKFHQDQQTGFDIELNPDEYMPSNVLGSLAAAQPKLGSREGFTNDTGSSSRKHSSVCTRNWIDLNYSVDVVSSEEVTTGTSFIFRTLTAEVMHGVQLSTLSDVNSCDKTSKTSVGTQATMPLGGQNEHGSAQFSSTSARKPLSSSCKPSYFDLNIIQPEEESAPLPEHQATYSSMSEGSSAAVHGTAVDSHASANKFTDFQIESSGSCSKELLNTHQNDTVHNGIVSKEQSLIRGDIYCDCSNPEASVKLHMVSSVRLSTGFEFTQQNSDKSLSRCPTTLSNAAYAFDLNVDASLERTDFSCVVSGAAEAMQRADEKSCEQRQSVIADISTIEQCRFQQKDLSIDINIHNVHGTRIQDLLHPPCLTDDPVITQLDPIDGCPVPCNPGSGIPDSVYLQEMCNNDQLETQEIVVQKQSQARELDSMVLMAAEALCHFSMKSPASSLYDPADEQHTQGVFEELPQYSSDSFESIILSLPEVQVDKCTPLASLTEEGDKKDDSCRFKTRSGRRLRDFQKDILPGIVSLSRHEICEDMHAFTEIMRPDSQRKRGTEKAFGGTFCTTLRNRRFKKCAVSRKR